MTDKSNRKTTQNSSQTTYSGINELWANERTLTNYNHYIVAKFSSTLSPYDRVLEFGAGIGTLASIFNENYSIKPDCIEIDCSLRKVLLDRNFSVYDISQLSNNSYDLIYTSNVLEHIPDDLSALKELHKLLRPKGSLMIYVPAFMLLYSSADEAIGHYRRYSKQELVEKLRIANFSIKTYEYCDSIGFFAWLLTKFSKQNFENKIGAESKLRFYDRFLFPISKFFDAIGIRYCFGKNIFIHAVKI